VNKLNAHSCRRLVVERLEDRKLMANFGTAWPAARSLSVSFPTDDAAIGAYRNSAREVLDQVTDRLQWQEAALRAFQTWSVHGNFNVGLVPDRGDDFGSVGLSTNDPRFGEFRIGAFPQPGVLANALPYQQIAGTWSGDVLLNTQANFFLADMNTTGPIQVPAPNEKGPAVELFSVLLHEAGNALGLADNNISGAVMNGIYRRPNVTLKSSDIAAIRQLYGPRSDIYETTSNNSRALATRINYPAGFTGTRPLSVNGSLNTMSDVDFYRLAPLAGQEKVSVRLWASGISLLKAKIEVLDRFGNKLADAKADSIFENNLQLDIGSLQDHPTLFIRVARNSNDVFGIGDYRLDIDYRDLSLQPSLVPPAHDADAEDDNDPSIDFVSVDALFSSAGLVDNEIGTNDTLTTATTLETTIGFLTNSRYELQSALSSASDRDLFRFRAPAFASPTLSIAVDPVGIQNPRLEVVLLNSRGDRAASQLTRKPDGGLTIVVANPVANEQYVLFVRTAAGSPISRGNYVATVDFATDSADSLRRVFAGSVTATSENVSRFTTYKTQLFRFDLSTQAASANAGVQLNIYDGKTGNIVSSFAAASGVLRTAYVWLGAGEYYLLATSRSRPGTPALAATFSLRADVISDDQGPNPIDPTKLPPPTLPEWDWEQAPPTVPAVINSVEPPFENPWTSDFDYSFLEEYYRRFLT
jgi:Matrixin